jgi:hypothetical protein
MTSPSPYECKCTGIILLKLCPGCFRHETEQAAEKVQAVQDQLIALLHDVCPLCAAGDATYCEVVDGRYQHVGGECKGGTIRQLMTHADDVRDQYASEFNKDREPRCRWGVVAV